MEIGTLTEISPFGTGFIEFPDGRVQGFHHSMLSRDLTRDQWPLLEGRTVAVESSAGTTPSVRLVEASGKKTSASGAS
jgi:hypothetical protein